jgi:UDP-N-acetylmuramoylalanine--D-glutamate ligase
MTRLSLPHGLDRLGRAWTGRRVAVVGLARSGAAAARLLRTAGCEVTVTEARPAEQLNGMLPELRSLGIHIETGGHTRAALDRAELVITSPGVPESSLPLTWAAARGVPVMSEIDLAFLFCPSRVVAVTGTNGKSTTVTLIAEALSAARRPAVACGNLGIPFSSVIDRLTPETIAVVEVSSFQLARCEVFHPSIGVLLNIGTNHLDRHQDVASYLEAKARLFRRHTPDDWAVLNAGDPHLVPLGRRVASRVVWFGDGARNAPQFRLEAGTQRVLSDGGQAVLQVCRLLGVADPLTWQVMRSFRGLEHRLEHVGTVRGTHFVNDSKSTTPESLLFALRRTSGEVAVILGGRDKGLDFRPLVEALHEPRVKGVVLIGESRNRLKALFNGTPNVRESGDLPAAVREARELAGPGGTVLFSPACASFDMFRDFEHRGRAFKDIVHQLEGAAA